MSKRRWAFREIPLCSPSLTFIGEPAFPKVALLFLKQIVRHLQKQVNNLVVAVNIKLAAVKTLVHVLTNHSYKPYDPQNVVDVLVGDKNRVNAFAVDSRGF